MRRTLFRIFEFLFGFEESTSRSAATPWIMLALIALALVMAWFVPNRMASG